MRDRDSERARKVLSGCRRVLPLPCWGEGDDDDAPEVDEGGRDGSSSSKA